MKQKIVLLATVEEDGSSFYMPLSTLAIGTIVAEMGLEPVLLDVQTDEDWQNQLELHLPDAFLFGVTSLTGKSISPALESIRIARESNPEVPIVWGGYHATLAYASIFKEGLVDYIIRGYGEESFEELLKVLKSSVAGNCLSDKLRSVPNLVFKDGEKLVVNTLTQISDMNGLPPMNYDLINVEKYYTDEQRHISYITSYGCPWACTFCAEPSQSLRRWKKLEPVRVVNELSNLWDRYKPERISLMDPNFSTDIRRVQAIVEEMIRQDRKIEIMCDMRARDIVRLSEKIDLKQLKKVGFVKIFVGLESGSDRMLSILKKGSNAQDALDACQALDSAGIQSYTSFIHDLPEEREEDREETFKLLDKLCRLSTNRQFHHYYMPFASTEIYNKLIENSVLDTSLWKQADWANSSTYGSKIWSGQPAVRKHIVKRLKELKAKYPEVFKLQALPADP